MKADCRIIKGSMGSYLLPPNHPGYFFEIEYDLRKKKENRGACSLEYFAFEKNVSSEDVRIQEQAKQLINDWTENKPDVDSVEVKTWIEQVIKHMGKPNGLIYIQKYYPEVKDFDLTVIKH